MAEQQNWSAWFQNNLTDLWELFQNLIQRPAGQPDWTIDTWQPSAREKAFAWELYVDLRTRLATQPLHFLSGDEATALESLFRLFQIVRDLEKKHGVEAVLVTSLTNVVLNSNIRPVTARWHKRKLEGKLHPEDLRREFRETLLSLQPRLREFQQLLLRIAGVGVEDGSSFELQKVHNQETVPLGDRIIYDEMLGYDHTGIVKQEHIASIIAAETVEIQNRRDAVEQTENTAVPRREPPENTRKLLEALNKHGITRRGDKAYVPVNDIVGLAISGGGIRSATFALGVVQGLTQRGIFKQVDVVSTVSGGGYLGSFLSTYLNTDDPHCGPTIGDAPFKPEVAGDSRAIRSLRNHSRYIQPSSFDGWLTTLGQVAYGIVSNLIILSFWVFIAVLATFSIRTELQQIWLEIYAQTPAVVASVKSTGSVSVTAPESAATSDQQTQQASAVLDYWQLTDFTKGWLVATAALVFLLPMVQRFRHQKDPIQARVSFYEKLTLVFVVLLGAIVAVDQLPAAHYGYIGFMKWVEESVLKANQDAAGWSLTASMVTVGNLIGLLIARAQWVRDLARAFPILGKGLFLLLWLCGPLLCAFGYFELCRVYIADPKAGLTVFGIMISPPVLIGLLAVGSFIYSYMCNINFTSLHRFYRNRLCATYLLRHSNSGEPEVRDFQKLSELRQIRGSTAPYHLINSTLNLPSSKIDDLRGRNSDFFLFSKHVCGSPVVGYFPTTKWESLDPHLDLGTAMAISGAAAAPQMGMGSIKGASFLMTLLNVRLAYWLRRPFCDNRPTDSRNIFSGPGPLYLAREALNLMSEDIRYLNISDGGHIENLGVYELLRRRCKFIIAIDGEHDPELTFPSLRKLQRFAEVDLKITIDINVERLEWNLPAIFQPPDKGERMVEDKAAERQKPEPLLQRYSRGHFAIGRIAYPKSEGKDVIGWLLYIKLSVTGNEPDYVLDYRRQHPEFPHQTTNDQIFEEDQFEAYRALGEHVSGDLFTDEILSAIPHTGRTSSSNLGLQQWFGALANGLSEA